MSHLLTQRELMAMAAADLLGIGVWAIHLGQRFRWLAARFRAGG